jgi:hypothetical protein
VWGSGRYCLDQSHMFSSAFMCVCVSTVQYLCTVDMCAVFVREWTLGRGGGGQIFSKPVMIPSNPPPPL